MAFVHHTMLTAENLRGLPSKQLHTNVEPHYSPRSRAAPLCGVGGLVGVYSRPVIGGALFGPLSGFRYCLISFLERLFALVSALTPQLLKRNDLSIDSI